MLITLLAGAALAQDSGDALLLQPTIDQQRTLFTESARVNETGMPTARVIGGFAFNPQAGGGDPSDAFTAQVTGGYSFEGVRLGARIPLIGTTGFGSAEGDLGVGDLGLDAKVALIEYQGLAGAVHGQLFLPTSNVDGYGRDGASYRLGAIGEFRTGPFLAAGNVGLDGGPDYFVRGDEVNTALYGNAAVGYAPQDLDGGVALELVGWTDLDDAFTESRTSPLEAVATGWYEFEDDWALNGGLGVGLNDGYGASDGRVMVGVTYAPGMEMARPTTVGLLPR